MAKFIDASGATQEVEISLETIRAASNAETSLRDHLNTQYGTDTSRFGEVFAQVLASEGIVLNPSKMNGIKAPTLDAVFNPVQMQAGVLTGNGNMSNQARVLLMPAILAMAEDKLLANLQMNPAAFDSMVAIDNSVSSDWVIWPEVSYARPEAARSQRIAQLAPPASMLTLTTSEKSMRIPTSSLGVEWSEQSQKVIGLDYLALSIARQIAIENNERANTFIYAMLNGDLDSGQASLASISGKTVKASALDATVTLAGQLTQRAWMKYLYRGRNNGRTITHVVTDIDGALAIEGRTGKPVITGDNPNSPRIDTLSTVMNATWGTDVKVFITNDPNWPVNTIMGIDANYAIQRVTSTSASYSAQEQFVLKRSTAMRFDWGQIARRMFDDAFDVLSLIP